MNSGEQSVSRAETLAVVYLVAPLFIFFAYFIRLEIAIPACALVALQIYQIMRRTAWRQPLASCWMYVYFSALAALWIALSIGVGSLQNSDWFKHYSVLNFLAQNTWPSHADITGLGDAVIRYSIGWYLIPALVLKITGAEIQTLALTAWSALGVFLLFCLLPDLVGTQRKAVIAAPLVFIVFGGADLIGTVLTHYRVGPVFHFEWWASWIEFPANTTSIFWVPQHALPAWLGLALFMRYRERTSLLPYFILLMSAIVLWSPFSAIGLMPFFLVLLWRHGFGKILLDWRPIVSTVLLAVPLAIYLTAKAESIPAGFIASVPCITDHRECFTWTYYVLFLLLEVSLPLAILFLWKEKEQGFLAAAAIALCLIPLYRIGIYNDFAMRASLPALAVLAILCAKALVRAPPRYSRAVVVVLLMALPTSVGEIYRGFLPGPSVPPATTFDDQWATRFLRQYFAPQPVWVLKPSPPVTTAGAVDQDAR